MDNDCITMNWIIIGLNWTRSLKCLEMTFGVIWRYINKTELNLTCFNSIKELSDKVSVWCVGITPLRGCARVEQQTQWMHSCFKVRFAQFGELDPYMCSISLLKL